MVEPQALHPGASQDLPSRPAPHDPQLRRALPALQLLLEAPAPLGLEDAVALAQVQTVVPPVPRAQNTWK